MGKLSSKLRKNENYTDILPYQIYFSKLSENLLKYYWLNVFKEIATDFNPGFQTTTESPTGLSNSLLF